MNRGLLFQSPALGLSLGLHLALGAGLWSLAGPRKDSPPAPPLVWVRLSSTPAPHPAQASDRPSAQTPQAQVAQHPPQPPRPKPPSKSMAKHRPATASPAPPRDAQAAMAAAPGLAPEVRPAAAPSADLASAPDTASRPESASDTATPAPGLPGSAPLSAPNPAPAQEAGPPAFSPARFDVAYLDNPAPVYPSLARRRQQEGEVLVRVRVSPEGRPQSVQIAQSSGVAALDQAALAAVRGWRFQAARRGQDAVADTVLIPLRFRLTD